MARNVRGYQPDLDTGKIKRERQSVLERIKQMCDEQGVNPEDTLTAEDVKKFMCLTHAEKNMINLISSGFPVRNSQAVLRAIEMKVERSSPKPSSEPKDASITVNVNTLADPTSTLSMALPRNVDPELLKAPSPSYVTEDQDLDDEEVN